MSQHIPPQHDASSFSCPHCGVCSQQDWNNLETLASIRSRRAEWRTPIPEIEEVAPPKQEHPVEKYRVSSCNHCGDVAIWNDGKMVYPETSLAPPPHDDMPEELKGDFEEARTILAKSPRGAAALLRLCVQKLMPHLGETGKNINDDIGNLVSKGLPVPIQQALDVVRVIGNESVHPGQIDLNDTPETAHTLFDLMNIIVEVMIAQPKRIDDVYGSLPESKRKGIEDRDSAT